MKQLKRDMSDAGKGINTAKNEIEKKLERSIVSSENDTELIKENELIKIK